MVERLWLRAGSDPVNDELDFGNAQWGAAQWHLAAGAGAIDLLN